MPPRSPGPSVSPAPRALPPDRPHSASRRTAGLGAGHPGRTPRGSFAVISSAGNRSTNMISISSVEFCSLEEKVTKKNLEAIKKNPKKK